MDGKLTLSIVFQTVSLMFTCRFEICNMLPSAIQRVNELNVSAKRIQNLLTYKEITSNAVDTDKQTTSKDEEAPEKKVVFNNVTASWSEDDSDSILQNVTFKCSPENSLVMVVGPVGSGKSSLLMTVMNELTVKKGDVEIEGSIAYTAQQPWIFSGTIRQNILFGCEYKKDWFQNVIKACGLHTDMRRFQYGDLTMVGEKGVTLSGGQKARVSLARAVYSDKDIYLLDDPLSAVDAKVGRYIFENCIQTLLKDKLVILVTHQIQFLQDASDIICLQYGNTCEGSLKDFQKMGIDLGSIMDIDNVAKFETNKPPGCKKNKQVKYEETLEESEFDGSDLEETCDENQHLMNGKEKQLNGLSKHLTTNLDAFGIMSGVISTSAVEEIIQQQEHSEEDNMATGSISMATIKRYFVGGMGWFMALLVPVIFILGQGILSFTDFYIAQWARSEQELTNNQTITSALYHKGDRNLNLVIFGGVVLFALAFDVFRSAYLYWVLIKCNRFLHNSMFNAVLKAPMFFFNTHPIGQILNRFSRDTHIVDEDSPWILSDVIRLGLLLVAIIVINAISVPYVLIFLIPLFVAFYKLRIFYMTVGREMKRLDAAGRSALYTHLSATLSGMSTIRAFGLKQKVTEDFHACNDYQAESWLMFISSVRWFGMRLDLISTLFSIVAIYAPVIALYVSGDVDANAAGVGVTYALTLGGIFQYWVRQTAEAENILVSVERLIEYADIEPEPDAGDHEKEDDWPQHGNIVAKDTSFRYHASLDRVLKDLSFKITGGEKIGIVGRTGAGKSTLLNLLFRMGINQGSLIIDGVDIASLRLKDLRRALSIIPQDPVLFNGTLRRNLDPFYKYNDDEIWQALAEVQMLDTVSGFENKLETEVAESGSNFSVGERQLFCLARALLKKNKILVIDEATANVDFETDALIQETIRKKFKPYTVLTIAHRLDTIIDSDRVMVLDDGKIVEFDVPYNLLQTHEGHLKRLVDQTGDVEAKRLEEQAREAMRTKLDDSILDTENKEAGGVCRKNGDHSSMESYAILEVDDVIKNQDESEDKNEDQPIIIPESEPDILGAADVAIIEGDGGEGIEMPLLTKGTSENV